MITEFVPKYFINPAIEHGIRCYKLDKEGKNFNNIHKFEMYVIKALTIIYGEKSILLPYKIDNEKAFICNLLIYDVKEASVNKFLSLMNEYYEFVTNFRNIRKANGLMNEIEKILIEMINKRSKSKEFTEEDFQEFDSIFNPVGDLRKLKKILSTEDGLIEKTWQDNKFELTNTQLRMRALNPNLLMPEEYAKYGFDIKSVASMSALQIENINNKIKEENEIKNSKKRLKRRNRIVLSCGNGFVDKLVLTSVIATEIMIGLIIATHIGG